MSASHLNYWKNIIKLVRNNDLLDPLVVMYYVTTKCNLDCQYCEDFGSRKNSLMTSASLEEAKQILRVIKEGSDNLFITGGEPFTYPNINELITFAKEELQFRNLTMITNGYLLPQHEGILHLLDRMIISLDSPNPDKWHKIINAPLKTAELIIENIKTFAANQEIYGNSMILNSVLTPDTLEDIESIVEFCINHRVTVSFSPQAVGNWPKYELLVSEKYKNALEKIISLKKSGAPILGSNAYYKTLINFSPYKCFPTLAPRVMPNGDLIYPCRPIEKEEDSHGGRINLLEIGNWEQTMSMLADEYGQPPKSCTSCFQQCYAEPSLMQSKPFSHLGELIRFSPSREGKISTYTPG